MTDRWTSLGKEWVSLPAASWVPRVSALVFLVHLPAYNQTQGTLQMAWLLLGLIISPLISRSAFWWVALVLQGSGLLLDAYELDNHYYLSLYWMLALALSLCRDGEEEVGEALALNGRWLIGICMGFAVYWKLVAPDYSSGAFFEFLMNSDSRFHLLAQQVGGLSPEQLTANTQAIIAGRNPLTNPASLSFHLDLSDRFRQVVFLSTWWTLLIEALCAAAFLWPVSRHTRTFRHIVLMIFAVTIYAAVPVKGFGTLLLVMGAAQCGPDQPKLRWGYLAVLIIVELYGIPWLAFL